MQQSPKRSKSKQESWGQPHHILLVMIILQGGFMIFMGLKGAAHHESRPKVEPHHRPAWKAEPRISSQDLQSGSFRLRIEEAAKKTLSPDAIKNHQDNLKQVKGKTRLPRASSRPQYKSMLQEKEWELNSMEFPGALHFHFIQEQEEPFFRYENKKHNQDLTEKYELAAKEALQLMVKKKSALHSCFYFSKETQQLRLKSWCFEVWRKGYNGIIVYNSQPFARTWCWKTIRPNSIQRYAKLCPNAYTEPPRLLLVESDKLLGTQRRDWKKLPPVVFERKNSNASIEAVRDCDVPCKFSMDTCMDKYDNDLKGAACLPEVSDWTVQGTDFKFRYSMLDPRLAPVSIGISRKAYRENQFYATRSFQSEIPLSNFDWDRYGDMNTPKNDFITAGQKGICFMHLEPCLGEIRPGIWASKVQEAFKSNFDYYGPCNFGPQLVASSTRLDLNISQDRQAIMGEYMFTLIIGHSQTPDMVTDLIWDALTAGSIPVYHGAPNVREHVPPNSIVVAGEHSSQQTLAEHLNELMQSRKMWKEFHQWRDEETATLLIQKKYGFLKEKSSSSYCRMCRWALATKYSLGWDPSKQAIKKPALDRQFCVSPKDEVKGPIEELWMSDLSMQRPLGRKICQKESAKQTFEYDDLTITRQVTSHDNGMIDIAIIDIKSLRANLKVVLRLGFPGITNLYGAHIIEPHQVLNKQVNASDHLPIMSSIAIQDDKTRATIITSWATDMLTPKFEGLVDILIKDLSKPGDGSPRKQKSDEIGSPHATRLMEDEVLKVRIILEDVNFLRDEWTEYNLSPYARLMITDFLDPLMIFYGK